MRLSDSDCSSILSSVCGKTLFFFGNSQEKRTPALKNGVAYIPLSRSKRIDSSMPAVGIIFTRFTVMRLGKSKKSPGLKPAVTPFANVRIPSSFCTAVLYTSAAYISANTPICGRTASHAGSRRAFFLLKTYDAPSPICVSSIRSTSPPFER